MLFFLFTFFRNVKRSGPSTNSFWSFSRLLGPQVESIASLFVLVSCRLARFSVVSLRAPFCFSLALSARSFLVSCRVVRFSVVSPRASFRFLLVFVLSFVVVFCRLFVSLAIPRRCHSHCDVIG